MSAPNEYLLNDKWLTPQQLAVIWGIHVTNARVRALKDGLPKRRRSEALR